MPIFWLKTLAKGLLLPPAGPLLLAALGVLLLRRRPVTARLCVIAGIGSLWLLSTPWVADGLTRAAEHYPPLNWQDAAGAQAIVILGGGGQRGLAPEYGGPAADPVLMERLAYGAFIAQKTGLPILVTGFGIEAAAMRETLRHNFGVEARWVDDQARDTFENAQNSERLLSAERIHRIILVTRATHMWRSVHELTSAGFAVVPAPVGMVTRRDLGIARYEPGADALQRSSGAVYELIGEPVRILLAASRLRRH
jgi:uncharacterized SAM-binding protein YcdF (DUF218 family)